MGKICITSSGKDLESKVDLRFGKADCFLIIDTDSMEHEYVENEGRAGPKSGLSAARLMVEKKVEAVISGCVGDNAKSVLKLGNIRAIEDISRDETLRHVVEKFKAGRYEESS